MKGLITRRLASAPDLPPGPLVRDRQRGRQNAHPRIASWGIWTAARAVGTAVAVADRQGAQDAVA